MNLKESITLRPATVEDVDFRRKLYDTTRRHEFEAVGWNDQQKSAFLEMQFRMQNQGYALAYPQASDRIMELNDKPVGRFLTDEQTSELVIIDIAVLPEFRGQGIGSHVIKGWLHEAMVAAKPVRLSVLRANPAVALYERLGFSIISEDAIYLQMLWKAPAAEP